ncbi:hypothetical protein AEQ67_28440 [Pseudomonas sp. RIT-PI-q]|uniref:hypothetical protein n=1 Tax=Pseudomonas sp. RIT-PI-q TaxID=1690247 RepID=UPI0006CD88C2|nr:hypothetical protein [Pseudomonas sp. RIT-PI-q]KPG91911.1 hypothetical protein AEQ67_28440 [Pseudomonas sp. RIT-PI-q]
MIVSTGQLSGEFQGFNDQDTIFEFTGGRKWRQATYKYCYYYAYMPHAKVVQEGGRYTLYVTGLNNSVEVHPA